ncbi:MAG: hypothetical protein QUS12_00830 [Methanosarcina sp.]|jgi:hypothetical protein|nr:hypothetical protein [Methanosarcina sp.]
MITREHIEIFKKYKGDGDGFVRSGKQNEKEVMTYSDWKLMEEFIQDINLIKKGLASNSYTGMVLQKLNENCDNIDTLEEFKVFALAYKK